MARNKALQGLALLGSRVHSKLHRSCSLFFIINKIIASHNAIPPKTNRNSGSSHTCEASVHSYLAHSITLGASWLVCGRCHDWHASLDLFNECGLIFIECVGLLEVVLGAYMLLHSSLLT